MPNIRSWYMGRCGLWIIVAWTILLPGIGVAETMEEVVNPKSARNEWVSDMAGVLDEETMRRLNMLIDRLEQKTAAEIAVVTIRHTDGRTPKEFATDLFNRWKIGKKGQDNGVLVLLVMEARRIEVETGYGVEGVLPDDKVGEILNSQVIPRFKQGNFSGGLLTGVQEIAEILMSSGMSSLPTSSRPQKPFVMKWLKQGMLIMTILISVFLILLLVVIGSVTVFLLIKILSGVFVRIPRNRNTRYCSQCQKQMSRLKREQGNAYLSLGQRFEEELGSVDYRVWCCDDCRVCSIEQHPGWRSRHYRVCPTCGNQSVDVRFCTLKDPTYELEGQKEVRKTCRFSECGYERIDQYAIARLERSSSSGGWFGGDGGFGGNFGGGSSGGGSFGGGSSGGGGAGGSW